MKIVALRLPRFELESSIRIHGRWLGNYCGVPCVALAKHTWQWTFPHKSRCRCCSLLTCRFEKHLPASSVLLKQQACLWKSLLFGREHAQNQMGVTSSIPRVPNKCNSHQRIVTKPCNYQPTRGLAMSC